MDTPFIRLTNVHKRYGERVILRDVSIEIAKGQTVALIGPSGGGKSTLLRCINGLCRPDGGEVRVGPHTLTSANGASPNLRAVRLLVGMVFQDFQLFPHLSALDNVLAGPRFVLGNVDGPSLDFAKALLDRVGLGERMHNTPRELSGGQKQRVAIARALAMRPQALLCDEITSALDPELKHEVLEVLDDLRRDGMTLLLVTHEIGFARRAADRVVVLADAGIIEDGPPADVLDRPQHRRTQQFLERVLA